MTKQDTVRCLNKTTNQVRGFPRWMCDGKTSESLSWQRSTGFVPQELQPMESEGLNEILPEENIQPRRRGRPKINS